LSEPDFDDALSSVDSNIGKKMITFLHDAFGFSNKLHQQQAVATLEPRPLACDAQLRGYTIPESIFLLVASETWRVAVCVLACLCCDVDVGAHTLHMLLWTLFRNAAERADSLLQQHAVLLVAAIVGESADFTQSWMSCFLRSPLRVECMDAIAMHLRSPLGVSEASVFSGNDVSPMLGMLCAVVRLGMASGARMARGQSEAPPSILQSGGCSRSYRRGCAVACEGSWLGASGAMEERVVRRGALLALLAALDAEVPEVRSLTTALVEHTHPQDFADASRYMRSDESLAVLRVVERLIKDAGTAASVRDWARCCVSEFASNNEAEANLKRAAICTIACSVHDEDPEVRSWARDFLTDASNDLQAEGEAEGESAARRNPMRAVLRAASESSVVTSTSFASFSEASPTFVSTASPPSDDGATVTFEKDMEVLDLGSFDIPHQTSQDSTDAASSEGGCATPSTMSTAAHGH